MQRVVDLVTEHAVRRPGESLLVVTIGLRHAARIEEALRAEVVHNLELRRWLDVHWTGGISEPFLVRPVHRVAGVERDAVIVSIGLARDRRTAGCCTGSACSTGGTDRPAW